jgi:hypothetical protein
MRFVTRLLLTACIGSFGMSAFAQQGGNQGGNQGSSTPGGGNQNLGQQADLTQQLSDLNFTRTTNTGITQSNIFNGFFGNPMFTGRIGGSTGQGQGQSQFTGGFGQQLYSTGTTGGMTGAGGNFGGAQSGAGTRAGGGTGATGFGGSTSSGATGFGGGTTTGARTGATSATGFSTGTTGTGATTGGLGGMTGGRNSMMGGRMGTGTNTGSQYVIASDRPVSAILSQGGAAGVLGRNAPPLAQRAQIEIRTTFDRSTSLAAGKSIQVDVSADGIVRLTGSVATPEERKLAAGLAQTTPGVRAVVNEITVTNP